MKETTHKLLAYSKEFYLSGKRELDANDQTSIRDMVAVLRFHDAVEFCTMAIVEENTINVNRSENLDKIFQRIEKEMIGKTVPYKHQIDLLTTTRGKIKHHAVVPSDEETQRHKRSAIDFLERVCREFFEIDFQSISRVLLIENPRVRMHLEAATTKRDEGAYLEALIDVKKAFFLARPSDTVILHDDNYVRRNLSSIGSRFYSFDRSNVIPTSFQKELDENFKLLANRIERVEANLALVLMGVDVFRLRRFEEITPHLQLAGNDTCWISWRSALSPSIELVDEAIDLLIDMALTWERMGIIARRPIRMPYSSRPDWNEIRRENWNPYLPEGTEPIDRIPPEGS